MLLKPVWPEIGFHLQIKWTAQKIIANLIICPFLHSSELSHFACKVLCVRDAGTLYTVYMMQVYCIYDAGILYTVYMMQVYSTVYSILNMMQM